MPVLEIGRLAGLDFGKLADSDPAAGSAFFESTESGLRELESLDQIVLGGTLDPALRAREHRP